METEHTPIIQETPLPQNDTIVHPISQFNIWLHEVFEALISVVIIFLVMEKEIDVFRILKLSLIIGSITYVIEFYDQEFKQNLKKGMNFSVGGSLIKNA